MRTSSACSNIFKLKRKSLRDLCAPKAKLPTLSYRFFPSSKGISCFRNYETDEKVSTVDSQIVQLQKSGTVFQPRRISSYATLHRLSRVEKQYTKILEGYDTWSQVFNQATKIPSSDNRQTLRAIKELKCFSNFQYRTNWVLQCKACSRGETYTVLSVRKWRSNFTLQATLQSLQIGLLR